MKYRLKFTGEFKRSLKRCLKRGYDEHLLTEVLELLVEKGHLPEKYRPHILHGQYEGYWECHIQSDWLLIWDKKDDELVLMMVDTGTHADLFRKNKR
jgi:mRNA interferase YafQ